MKSHHKAWNQIQYNYFWKTSWCYYTNLCLSIFPKVTPPRNAVWKQSVRGFLANVHSFSHHPSMFSYLQNRAVNSESLVNSRCLVFTSFAPDDHVAGHIQLFIVVHLFPNITDTFPQLPTFLKTKGFWRKRYKTCCHHHNIRSLLSGHGLANLFRKPESQARAPTPSAASYPLPLVDRHLAEGAHQAGRPVGGAELGGGLQPPQLEGEGAGMAPAVFAAPGGELLQVAGRNHRRPLVRVVRHGAPISSLFLGRTGTRRDRAPAPAPPGGHAGSGSAAGASADAGGSSHGRGHLVAPALLRGAARGTPGRKWRAVAEVPPRSPSCVRVGASRRARGHLAVSPGGNSARNSVLGW